MDRSGQLPHHSNNGSEPYRDRLRLERAPFENRTQQEFFFAEPFLMQRMDLLQHLTQFSDLLLIVSGGRGSGKTMLCNELVRQAGDNWRICILDATKIGDQDSFLEQISQGFGLDPIPAHRHLPERLVENWKAAQIMGRYPVLLIDNAHCLDDQFLQTLLYLDGSPRATLHRVRIIVFAESGMDERLADGVLEAADNSGLVHTMELAPLTLEQTGAYLAFRLAVAGYSGESPFSSHEVESIHKVSKGVPYGINELAHQTLLRQERKLSEGVGVKPYATAGRTRRLRRWGLLLAVAGGLAFIGLYNTLRTAFEKGSVEQNRIPLDVPADAEHRADTAHRPLAAASRSEVPGAIDPASDGERNRPALVKPVQSKRTGHTPGDGVMPQTPTTSQEAAGVRVIPGTAIPAPQTSPATPSAVAAAGSGRRVTDSSHANAADPEQTALYPGGQRALDSGSPRAEYPGQQQSGRSSPSPAADRTTTRPATAAARPPAPGPETQSRTGPRREEWILGQSPDRFTLQLVSVRNETAVLSFVNRYQLQDYGAYFEKDLIGTKWYSLIYGSYANRSAALEAAGTLPAPIRSRRPWVRPLAEVQAAIRSYRKGLESAVR